MKTVQYQPVYCSRCRFYTPEGRRGGHCNLLGVPVQADWQACTLAVPIFMAALGDLDSLDLLPQPIEIHFPAPPLTPQPVYPETPVPSAKRSGDRFLDQQALPVPMSGVGR
ncbi:MAG: hypothetical protein KGQ93_05395 [Cyanobacteria bacterium REEB459]|nr:hypothetical protein [Cyanobacteria bacterium REEB459]